MALHEYEGPEVKPLRDQADAVVYQCGKLDKLLEAFAQSDGLSGPDFQDLQTIARLNLTLRLNLRRWALSAAEEE